MMKIYLIEHDEYDYDCCLGHIIVANNRKEIREIAKKASADEGIEVWNSAKVTKQGEYTGKNKKPFRVLTDFRAGYLYIIIKII